MARPIVTVPPSLLRQLGVSWDIDWRAQFAGETNAGTSPVVNNAFPRWVGTVQALLFGEAIASWRAIRAQAQGLRGIYQVTMLDPVVQDRVTSGTPYASGQPHDTGQPFAVEPFARAVGAAPAGALSLRVTADVAPKVGQIMGHGYWPFQVVAVDTVAQGVFDLSIQMPLRAPIADGDVIRAQGVGLFELTDPQMGLPAYGLSHSAQIDLGFREVLAR